MSVRTRSIRRSWGWLLALAIAAPCRSAPAEELNLFAASSLTDALKEVGQGFEKGTGHIVVFNLGGSNDLARQIKAGAPADVFFSADKAQMDRLQAEGLVRAGERAWRAYAWLTAAERYEAALALPVVAESDARERVMLLAMLAQLRRYDDPWRGIARLEEAEGLARRVGDRALEASCLYDQGHLRCEVGPIARTM